MRCLDLEVVQGLLTSQISRALNSVTAPPGNEGGGQYTNDTYTSFSAAMLVSEMILLATALLLVNINSLRIPLSLICSSSPCILLVSL